MQSKALVSVVLKEGKYWLCDSDGKVIDWIGLEDADVSKIVNYSEADLIAELQCALEADSFRVSDNSVSEKGFKCNRIGSKYVVWKPCELRAMDAF